MSWRDIDERYGGIRHGVISVSRFGRGLVASMLLDSQASRAKQPEMLRYGNVVAGRHRVARRSKYNKRVASQTVARNRRRNHQGQFRALMTADNYSALVKYWRGAVSMLAVIVRMSAAEMLTCAVA